MNCIELRQGQDSSCGAYGKKYFQQIVLVNKQDVEEYQILTSTVNISDEFTCRHRLRFRLYEGKSGFRFTAAELGNSAFASFEKTVKEGFPQYVHNIQVPVMGVDEQVKCLLKQLDNADYFGAAQFSDGTVEIYGFDYGLTSKGYNYDAQNGSGGSILNLSSLNDALEDEPPFVYESGIGGNANDDFNNNFDQNPELPTGDFNDDFNNDFYIGS
jgi:hypothetical protein